MLCPHCGNSVQVLQQLQGRTVACAHCGGLFVMPAEAFDPYYTWLGIPPSEHPPTHYRLLGLQIFEANATVIENAADRQMRHLHSMRTGVHAAESQRLLNEVAAARVCLLDPASKAAYDRQLQVRGGPPAAPLAAAGPPGS